MILRTGGGAQADQTAAIAPEQIKPLDGEGASAVTVSLSPEISPAPVHQTDRWIELTTRIGIAGTFLVSAASPLSISVTQIVLSVLAIALVANLYRQKSQAGAIQSPTHPAWPMIIPMGCFIAASLAAAVFSINFRESIIDSRDLFHFILFFAGLAFIQDKKHAEKVVLVLIAAGTLAAVVGLGQAMMRGITLDNRISGFQGMYMTYAGLLMLVYSAGFAYVLFSESSRRRTIVAAALVLILGALMLSLTRNTWLGVLAASFFLLLLKSVRLATVLPIAIALIIAISPASVQKRVFSVIDPSDATNRERLLVWGGGLKIAADYPLLGVGQNNFPKVYPDYRDPGVTEPNISHLHNNFIEIAVERGSIGLAAWCGIWIAFFAYTARIYRSARKNEFGRETGERLYLVTGPMAAAVAFLVSGMFEYNFGDAEVQMLMLYLMSLPFVWFKV